MNCIAGCGAPVARKGSRCADCAKALHAARQRARRGKPVLPPLPAKETQHLIAALNEARNALDGFESARERAERERGLDAMPYPEVDMWLRDIRKELTRARRAAAAWQQRAKDIRANTRTPGD